MKRPPPTTTTTNLRLERVVGEEAHGAAAGAESVDGGAGVLDWPRPGVDHAVDVKKEGFDVAEPCEVGGVGRVEELRGADLKGWVGGSAHRRSLPPARALQWFPRLVRTRPRGHLRA